MFNFNLIRWFVSGAAVIVLAGCTLHPPGEREERDSAAQLGKSYEKRFENRDIKPLSESPTPDQLVEYALLNNADLEQKFWTWQAAIEQIPQDGTQTTNVNIAGGTTITKGRASWGSSTVTLGNDPMTDIKWPSKLDAAAKQTLENAKATGQRFIKAKYELRSKVLGAYYDFALTAVLIRLERANKQLLEVTANTTESRSRAGAAGEDGVLKAKNEVDLSLNDISNMQSQLRSQRAALNALLSRPVDAELIAPAELPLARVIPEDDAQLLDLAAKQNPELLALAKEIRSRHEGIRLTKLQYVPDFNLSVGTDLQGMAQSILAQATIPLLRFEAINAAIAQAEANLYASEAMRRQTASDTASQVIADITSIRDVNRQIGLFDQTILPRLQQIVRLEQTEYESGSATFLDVLDGQRSKIAIERLVANLRATREKQVADLEALTTIRLDRLR